MAKKKREEEGGGSWMDTYGDLVTLLLTFFVMLYSMATVAEDKWAAIVKAFNNRFGHEIVDQIVISPDQLSSGEEPLENLNSGLNMGERNDGIAPNEMDELFIAMENYIKENQMEDSISIKQSDDITTSVSEGGDESTVETTYTGHGQTSKNIYIQFSNNVLFNPDESTLKKGSEKVITFLGECLNEVDDDIAMVIIKGHTANAPTSKEVDSRLLSSERAGTISNFLERKCKIKSTKLYPLGLAGDYPIASNDTEEGMSQNRRVEIVIIGKNSDLAKSGELLKILGASFEKNTGDIHDIAVN